MKPKLANSNPTNGSPRCGQLFANGAREWDSKAAHAVVESLLK